MLNSFSPSRSKYLYRSIKVLIRKENLERMREKCVQIYQNMFLKGEDVG
jgi:hypothetical protein